MWIPVYLRMGFPGGSVVKNLPANLGDMGSISGGLRCPGVGRKWFTPVFLPGKSHWQRDLAGYSPWGGKRVRQDVATKQQPQLPKDRVWVFSCDSTDFPIVETTFICTGTVLISHPAFSTSSPITSICCWLHLISASEPFLHHFPFPNSLPWRKPPSFSLI